ncbi:QcrA and Rieske domain-containing protein [Streptomyces millisiae]|uniref:Cytochrome bc1 complex Rieske iron-sulfur subunit n=1 Tax=Streptomyces millisiae TaxID=3075542 RepID=A0ABU2LKG2_9ACTN|nr:Rieske (2Fe-2S) protein [Streptomyces sp. DSM 44918]MDT0318074.1 Rieske (2Fe-2S) protein [Streptomyces sp. DSM 44918]
MTATSHSRRTVLAATAASAGALALAACGSDDDSSSGSPSPSQAADGGAGSEAGGDEASAGSGSGSAGGTAIADVADVPVGEAVPVTADGQEAMLFRADETTVACFSAICTHAGCSVQPEGVELRCPCHQSVFDAATGEVLGGPAPEPLPAIGVRIEGDQIVTE